MFEVTNIDVEGADELARVLKRLPREMRERVLVSAVRAGARIVRDEAIARAPVRADGAAKLIEKGRGRRRRRPGFLKRHIAMRRVRRGLLRGEVRYEIGPTREAFYGMFVEFGTRRAAPRPFLRPAFDAKAGAALEEIGRRLGQGIDRAAQRLASGAVLKRRRRRRR